MKKYLMNTFAAIGILYCASTVVTGEAVAGAKITITSIVNRLDGVFFGVTYAGGNTAVLSASQAKNALENACPTVRFAPGVLQ